MEPGTSLGEGRWQRTQHPGSILQKPILVFLHWSYPQIWQCLLQVGPWFLLKIFFTFCKNLYFEFTWSNKTYWLFLLLASCDKIFYQWLSFIKIFWSRICNEELVPFIQNRGRHYSKTQFNIWSSAFLLFCNSNFFNTSASITFTLNSIDLWLYLIIFIIYHWLVNIANFLINI